MLFTLAFIAALSPQEAADMSAVVGRPLPAMLVLTNPPPSITFAPGGEALPIFLNKDGGQYTCGDDDSARNVSSIVCGGGGSLGGFPGTDAEWQQVVDCVRAQFAPFNLAVTDQEPASGDYIEAVVGGSPGQAGMPSGVAGVSPYICGVIPTSIVYTFADVYVGSPDFTQAICETTAQEVAHSFGLDHELLCEDPMTYLSGCGDKSFRDEAVSCGEFEPRQCSCGNATQNSVQAMLSVLGPSVSDVEPPTVAVVSPADGAVLTANSTITVEADAGDDAGSPSVTLEWDFTGEKMSCPGSGGAWSCTRTGTLHTWTIDVGEGARTFRVKVRDFGGNEVATEDRSIWLSTDGSGPPANDTAPSIFIASPLDQATRPANEHLQITASVVDDSAVSTVELDWPFTAKVFACPSSDGTVSCTVTGSTYVWDLDVGTGDRTWSIRAKDDAGHTTTSGPYTLSLVDGATLPADDTREEDDTFDAAKPIACGEALDLIGNDADWFSVAVPAGQTASLTTSPALPVVTRGASLFGVEPATEAGPYHVEVACTDAPAPGSGGDGAGGDGTGGAGGDDGSGGGAGLGGGDGAGGPGATPIVQARGGSCASTDAPTTAMGALLLAMVAVRRRSRTGR